MIGSQGGFTSFGGGAGQNMYLGNHSNVMMGTPNANNCANPGAGGLGVGINVASNNGQIHVLPPNVVPNQETGSSQSNNAEYTLAGILHFLQSEWRRYEKDRNEWEIERAEMRARIALLEGERRGVENLKTDLMRRVKMLEYALRQERSKYLSSNNATAASGPPQGQAKNPLLQGLEKAVSSSGQSSPSRSEDLASGLSEPTFGHGSRPTLTSSSLFNPSTIGAGSTFNASTLGGGPTLANQLSRASSSAKDPKSRAKSRDYLKQCLQEISYLTSASTLNPLPDRGVASSSTLSGASGIQGPPRPRKMMIENVAPTVPQHQHQEPHSAGSLRRSTGQNVGNANASLGKGTGVKAGRTTLFASQPVMEESVEVEAAEAESEQQAASTAMSDSIGSFSSQSGDDQHFDDLARSHSLEASSQGFDQTHDLSKESGLLAEGMVSQQEPHDGSHYVSSSESSSSSQSSSTSDSPSQSQESFTDHDSDESDQVTAIFKPGGRDWQKLKEAGLKNRERRERERKDREADAQIVSEAQAQLALTSEKVHQLMSRSGKSLPSALDKSEEEDLANLSLHTEEEDATRATATSDAGNLMWKSKRLLKSHLDAVRAIAFDQSDLCLVSASDDNTVKFWKLDASSFNQPCPNGGADSDPLITFRGHSAAVTCLAVSHQQQRIYSGSLDSSIRVWQLPDRNIESYPPFEKSIELGCLVGHSQAVWDIALLPDKSDEQGLLASASADGTVKIWAIQKVQGGKAPAELQLSWDYFGTDPVQDISKERENLEKTGGIPVPTSVEVCHADLRLCAVGYANSVIKLFELKTGKQVGQLKSDATYDGTPSTQINKIVTHPTLPLLISAHEDGYIRMFDLETGACTLSMVAHLDAVTCLDIDASGLNLVSGGHDCSVRFWDIANGTLNAKDSVDANDSAATETKSNGSNAAVCRQEISSHRKKAAEGVLAVKYHPTAPFFASAGADGVIWIYG